jgi:hypothetical protein
MCFDKWTLELRDLCKDQDGSHTWECPLSSSKCGGSLMITIDMGRPEQGSYILALKAATRSEIVDQEDTLMGVVQVRCATILCV